MCGVHPLTFGSGCPRLARFVRRVDHPTVHQGAPLCVIGRSQRDPRESCDYQDCSDYVYAAIRFKLSDTLRNGLAVRGLGWPHWLKRRTKAAGNSVYRCAFLQAAAQPSPDGKAIPIHHILVLQDSPSMTSPSGTIALYLSSFQLYLCSLA
jgi:hypothetical protein